MPIVLRRLLALVFAMLAIYLIGANLFLNSDRARELVNRKPERFQASWSRAASWFPGVVMLWDVRLQGHARTVTWQASADRVHGGINLFALLHREVRSSWLHAVAVSAAADTVAEDLQPPEYRDTAWTLHFESIATSTIKHLRFRDIDVDTEGSATVGFRKQLRGGPLEILPSKLHFRESSIRQGDRTLFRDGDIDLGFAIARHWRNDAPGLAKLALMTGRIRVDGVLPILGFRLAQDQRWQGLFGGNDGDARLLADFAFEQSRLQPGGSIEVTAPLAGSVSHASFNDEARLHGELVGDDVKLSLHLPPPPQGSGSLDAELTIADARVDLPRDVKTLVKRSSGRLDVDWHFDALDWLDPLLADTRWLQLRGAGDVKAKLQVAGGVLQPGSSVDIAQVEIGVLVAEHRFHGRASATARVADVANAAAGATAKPLTINAVISAFNVATQEKPDQSLVRGKDLQIALATSSDLAQWNHAFEGRLRFNRAEMPDVRALNRYLPTGSVVLLGGSTRINGDLQLDAAGKVADANITVAGKQTRARLGAILLAGNFDLAARLLASKPRPGEYQLDGSTLKVDSLQIGDGDYSGGRPTWAKLQLQRGSIQTTKPLTIKADAEIEMENIRVLLGLFTRQREFPKWVVRLADAGVLHATGRMQSQGNSLIFDRVQASNQRFDAAARMHVQAGKPRGDLLLSWGALSLGLDVDGDERNFHLLRARHWYESRPDLLPATKASTR